MVGVGRDPAKAGPLRGDIHFVDFAEQGGHVIHGPHPALVIQTDRLQRSATVIVAPMASSARAAEFEPPFLVPVAARESGLPRDGWIKCDQPTTLPTVLLGPRVGRLSQDALDRLDIALRFVLDLGA